MLIQFATFFGFLLVAPVMPLFLSEYTTHEGVIGAAVGVFGVAAIVVRLFAGRILDQMGRRVPLLWGLVLFAAATAAYDWMGGLLLIFALRVVHGIAFGVVSTATSTMGADIVPADRRAQGMGYLGSAVSFAQAIAPLFGFAIVLRWGFGALFWIGALLSVAALVVAVRYTVAETAGPPAPSGLNERSEQGNVPDRLKSDPSGRPIWHKWIESTTLVPAGLAVLSSFGLGALFVLIPLYAIEEGMANAGVFFLVMGIFVLAVRMLLGANIDRLDAPRPLGVACIIFIAALFITAFLPQWFVIWGMPGGLLVAAALSGLSLGVFTPTLLAVAVARAPAHRRGTANGTFLMALDLGIGVGAAALGTVAATVGLAAMYAWTMAVPAIGLAYVIYFRQDGGADKNLDSNRDRRMSVY
ncbi:MAG: MFS transporter, partial [Thermaerobacterales bacterium]